MSPATEARWVALARAAARRAGEDEGQEALRQLLVFELDGVAYALPVESVREIVRMRPITLVPRLPAEVLGVVSLRGEIIEVVDLRRRLGLAPAEPGRKSRVIVASADEGRVAGLLVDSVREVIALPVEALRPAAGEAGAVLALATHGERFVSLLDLDRVLAIHAEQ